MKLSLILVLLVCIKICAAQTEIKILPYHTEKYSLAYPETWKLDAENYKPGVGIYTPLESKSDSFSDNLFLMIQDLSEHEMDLAEYKEVTEKQFKSLGEKIKVFQSEIVNKNGTEQLKIGYAMNMNGRDLQFKAVCFIKNKKAYLLTFTAEESKYANYINLADRVLESFILK